MYIRPKYTNNFEINCMTKGGSIPASLFSFRLSALQKYRLSHLISVTFCHGTCKNVSAFY